MRVSATALVRGLLAGSLAHGAWWGASQLSPVPAPPSWLLWLVALPLLALPILLVLSSSFHRRIAPAWAEEFPAAGEARVRPGGEFEWRPANEPRIQVRHGIVHRWWDAEQGATLTANVSFDVPDEVAPAVLAKATRRALRSASRALPARGKVRAKGAARDEAGPTSLVRVTLHVQGVGASADWARVASNAFARAFLDALRREGHEGARLR